MSRADKIIEKEQLVEFQEVKYSNIFHEYFRNNKIRAIWDVAYIMFLEPDEIRYQILDSVFICLSSPVSQLFHLYT